MDVFSRARSAVFSLADSIFDTDEQPDESRSSRLSQSRRQNSRSSSESVARRRNRGKSTPTLVIAEHDEDLDEWAVVRKNVKRRAKIVNINKGNPLRRPASKSLSSSERKKKKSKKLGDYNNSEWKFKKSCYDQEVEDENPASEEHILDRFNELISDTRIDMVKLRNLCWDFGIHHTVRPYVWKVLCGYYPPWPHLQKGLTRMKRQFYRKYVAANADFYNGQKSKSILNSIKSEMQVTFMRIKIFQSNKILNMVERVLFICIRESFEENYIHGLAFIGVIVLYNLKDISESFEKMNDVSFEKFEAEYFWTLFTMFNKLKVYLKDPMIFSDLLGGYLEELDSQLSEHLVSKNISYVTLCYDMLQKFLFSHIQKLPLILQLWDIYIVLFDDQFAEFHAAVCAFILLSFGPRIKTMGDAPTISTFLDRLPLDQWTHADVINLLNSVKLYFVEKNYYDDKEVTEFKNLEELLQKHLPALYGDEPVLEDVVEHDDYGSTEDESAEKENEPTLVNEEEPVSIEKVINTETIDTPVDNEDINELLVVNIENEDKAVEMDTTENVHNEIVKEETRPTENQDISTD
eukprot:TRINITY_DN7063_c0_g1_i1.p1 TRINITY_DN7063_c0_g1~~TRINITY_DN7063_c0_g1_i1.p1  ORF type:complete len:577 (-),score=129.09 TRINITY_DN7063_c0_g1_i1:467-2197(-)